MVTRASTVYVGFYRIVDTAVVSDSQRRSGQLPTDFLTKIQGFPSALPTSCKLVGSWPVSGGQAPGVMVVEADSFQDIAFINTYYAGWLQFDWHPTGGVNRVVPPPDILPPISPPASNSGD